MLKMCDVGYTKYLQFYNNVKDQILNEKTKYVYKKVTHKDDFQTNNNWLDKFKNLFGIILLNMMVKKFYMMWTTLYRIKKKFKKYY